MIRILYLGLVKKSPQWRQERKVMLENVCGVEPFIESVPQSLSVLSLGFLTNECVGVNPLDVLGVCVFTTSTPSACLSDQLTTGGTT